MIVSFGLSIGHYVIVESICLGYGSLHFGCVNNDIFLVGFGAGLMKLKLNTAQQSSLKLVEVRLHLVVLNRIIATEELTCKILSRVARYKSELRWSRSASTKSRIVV